MVPAGQPVVMRVFVEGGIEDMSGYQVKWQGLRNFKAEAATTGFKRQGARWVSENRATYSEFPEKLLDIERHTDHWIYDGPFEAYVVDKEGHVQGAFVHFPQVAATLPVIEKIDFVSRGAIHFFLPMSRAFANKYGKLALAADFKGFGRKFISLAAVDTYIAGSIPVRVDVKNSQLALWGPSLSYTNDAQTIKASTAGTGEASVVARLSGETARKYGWTLAQPRLLATLPVTLNKIELSRKSADQDAPYQLKLHGPAPMSNFTAQWYGVGGGSVPVTATSSGGVSEANLRGKFLGVSLLNAQGEKVMQLSGNAIYFAAPQPPPEVLLSMPALVPAGQKVRIEARVKNVEAGATGFCNWYVSENVGPVSPQRSTLQYLTNGEGYCYTVLQVKDEAALIGKRPYVEVRFTRANN
jgi:hypothetical protein